MAEIVNGAAINETHANVQRSRSTFHLKQLKMQTHRFGEYHPHFVLDGITSDKHPIRSMHVCRSTSLKAPLMQDIQMHKDYFLVTLRSILPFQADRVITNPPLGDDLPSDAYTNVSRFIFKVKGVHSAFISAISALDSSVLADRQLGVSYMLKDLVFLESVFSSGSLLSSLGCDLSRNLGCYEIQPNIFNDGDYYSIDHTFDLLITNLQTSLTQQFVVNIDGVSYFVTSDSVKNKVAIANPPGRVINWHDFLQKIRDTSIWSVSTPISSTEYNNIVGRFTDIQFYFWNENDLDIDISRLWAYHLSCAAFYTDDKIDYIYSADLFRQYISYLLSVDVGDNDKFNYNGIRVPYDYLSSHYFDSMCAHFDLHFAVDLQYFITLFGYHRSLRFKDYFTGSRTRPLAVGNTNIPVVSSNVSVVDVSRSIQVQKFLNAVQSTGRKFEEYLKGIFGVAPSPDHHNPLFLAHSSDSIFASEVENTTINPATATASDAQTITAVFRGNGNQFEYSVDVDEPSIIIGITSYDIERAYAACIERSFFIKDRYDMFLPQMQYVGDQPIYKAEIMPQLANPMNPFSYTFRDMQWKQMVNRAEGGFCFNNLPGFAFIFDRFRDSVNISPDFIRSYNSELDDFFIALTGYSLGTYYHFIVFNTNVDNASRPMAVNPQILG